MHDKAHLISAVIVLLSIGSFALFIKLLVNFWGTLVFVAQIAATVAVCVFLYGLIVS